MNHYLDFFSSENVLNKVEIFDYLIDLHKNKKMLIKYRNSTGNFLLCFEPIEKKFSLWITNNVNDSHEWCFLCDFLFFVDQSVNIEEIVWNANVYPTIDIYSVRFVLDGIFEDKNNNVFLKKFDWLINYQEGTITGYQEYTLFKQICELDSIQMKHIENLKKEILSNIIHKKSVATKNNVNMYKNFNNGNFFWVKRHPKIESFNFTNEQILCFLQIMTIEQKLGQWHFNKNTILILFACQSWKHIISSIPSVEYIENVIQQWIEKFQSFLLQTKFTLILHKKELKQFVSLPLETISDYYDWIRTFQFNFIEIKNETEYYIKRDFWISENSILLEHLNFYNTINASSVKKDMKFHEAIQCNDFFSNIYHVELFSSICDQFPIHLLNSKKEAMLKIIQQKETFFSHENMKTMHTLLDENKIILDEDEKIIVENEVQKITQSIGIFLQECLIYSNEWNAMLSNLNMMRKHRENTGNIMEKLLMIENNDVDSTSSDFISNITETIIFQKYKSIFNGTFKSYFSYTRNMMQSIWDSKEEEVRQYLPPHIFFGIQDYVSNGNSFPFQILRKK